jgi:hypothetical protein
MQKWLGLMVGAALSGLFVGACTTTAGDKYPTYDSMCDAKATEECQVASLCGASADACKTARKQVCLDAANTALQAGRKYTPSLAEGCVSATHDTYGAKIITPDLKTKMDDTCTRVYAGSVAKGGSCNSNYDCSGSAICDKQHCGDKVQKKSGDGCANPGEVCETGSFCQAQTGVSICVAREASGKPCNVNDLCLETLRCNVTCIDRVGPSQACASNDDCTTTAPYCDPAAGNVCTPGLSFAFGAADCHDYGVSGGTTPDAGSPDTGPPADAAGGG